MFVENQATRFHDVSRFQRDDDVITGARDRAGARVRESIFPLELQGIAGNFARAFGFRRGAMSVFVRGVESDLPAITRLRDSQLEDGLAAEEILIGVLAGPIRGAGGVDHKTKGENKDSGKANAPGNRGRDKHAHGKNMARPRARRDLFRLVG
ncbi:MAG: hypothetical protein M3N48_05950 [Verrucomicrobiota bacterium]|nr:hypothetical protein [Verrucomicrobiota bacterium]